VFVGKFRGYGFSTSVVSKMAVILVSIFYGITGVIDLLCPVCIFSSGKCIFFYMKKTIAPVAIPESTYKYL